MAQDCKSIDLEVGLVRAEPVEELRKTDSSRPSRGWRIYLALLAIGLCAAAAIFFAVYDLKKQDISMGNGALRHTLRQITGKNHTAINVEGKYNPSFSNTTVEWQDDHGQFYSGGGLKLEGNEIVVPRSGLYFVYSQVSFHVNCHASPNRPSLDTHYLSHQVFCTTRRVSKEESLTLLSAKRSGCEHEPVEEDSGRRWYSTINQGAIFQLGTGDRLRTETEPLSHVAGETGQTYFGVFEL